MSFELAFCIRKIITDKLMPLCYKHIGSDSQRTFVIPTTSLFFVIFCNFFSRTISKCTQKIYYNPEFNIKIGQQIIATKNSSTVI